MSNVTTAGKLVTIKGQEYTLAPPDWKDWEWLQNEMRGEFIKACRAEFQGDCVRCRGVGTLFNKETRRQEGCPDCDGFGDYRMTVEQEQRIRAQAFTMVMLGRSGGSWMLTPSGLARIVYAMLRHEHPSIEMREVAQWVIIEQDIELKNDAMEMVSASLPGSDKSPDAKKNGVPKSNNRATRKRRSKR